MTTSAAQLIREASEAVAGVHDPRDRLAQQVGYLQSIVRDLCLQYTGDGAKSQAGCKFAGLIAGDAPVLVEYEYEPGEASQTSGPPERCYEGSPASVAIIQALVNGAFCDPTDVFSEAVLARWQEEIEAIEDEAHAAGPPERDRRDDAIDFAGGGS